MSPKTLILTTDLDVVFKIESNSERTFDRIDIVCDDEIDATVRSKSAIVKQTKEADYSINEIYSSSR